MHDLENTSIAGDEFYTAPQAVGILIEHCKGYIHPVEILALAAVSLEQRRLEHPGIPVLRFLGSVESSILTHASIASAVEVIDNLSNKSPLIKPHLQDLLKECKGKVQLLMMA